MEILLIYHFFYPDPVISARLFSDLAAYLSEKGMEVTVYTGNRLLRESAILKKEEIWKNVSIRRFSHPVFLQSRTSWRLLTSVVMMLQYLADFFRHRKEYDAVLLGTDPQFSYFICPFLRLLNPRIKLFHWVFDLYPETGCVSPSRLWRIMVPFMKPFAFLAYQFIDYMVDIGPGMRTRLQKYHHRARCETLTPWALVESKQLPKGDPEIRRRLFGNAKIGLLYSGTIGYAHDITPFIELARQCRDRGIDASFCFAGYGNCYAEQTSMITPQDTNIRIIDFVSESELEKRLTAADIHLVSLRKGVEGLVVPSKFFSALATGRPVLFSGSGKSEIAYWCQKYQVGFTLGQDTLEVLQQLSSPEKLQALQQNALTAYSQHFSKEIICGKWYKLLNGEKCRS